jgi:hypothetical protein
VRLVRVYNPQDQRPWYVPTYDPGRPGPTVYVRALRSAVDRAVREGTFRHREFPGAVRPDLSDHILALVRQQLVAWARAAARRRREWRWVPDTGAPTDAPSAPPMLLLAVRPGELLGSDAVHLVPWTSSVRSAGIPRLVPAVAVGDPAVRPALLAAFGLDATAGGHVALPRTMLAESITLLELVLHLRGFQPTAGGVAPTARQGTRATPTEVTAFLHQPR